MRYDGMVQISTCNIYDSDLKENTSLLSIF